MKFKFPYFSCRSSDKEDANKKNRFDNVLGIANAISELNPSGLKNLLHALIKPIQAEHLIAVAECNLHGAPGALDGENFFFNTQSIFSSHDCWVRSTPFIELSLAHDNILTTPWHRARYIDALSFIGEGKSLGNWTQDNNHSVSYWLPWGIAFVTGGNHSIAAGILAGEGKLVVNEVIDATSVFDTVMCDGAYYWNTKTNEKIAVVGDIRRAAIFEIGRIISRSSVKGEKVPLKSPKVGHQD